MKNWTEEYRPEDLIIFEDASVVVVNKPAGVPSQPDKTGDTSALTWIEQHKKSTFHLETRLDRPVSGAVIFRKMNTPFLERSISKSYLAITTPPEKSEDDLVNYLIRDGHAHKARIVDSKDGKEATLNYKVVQSLDKYAVLLVTTGTGRFHQIRAQLSHIGCHIKGDVKYGARRGNPDRSIDLHAYQVMLGHVEQTIEAPRIGRSGIWNYVTFDKTSAS